MTTDSDMHVRWHIFFFGRVQGVGFRFTCREVAGRYEVSGWVKNVPNGSVEMIVEGGVTSVRNYVADVCDSTHGHVSTKEITKGDASNEFNSMQIRH